MTYQPFRELFQRLQARAQKTGRPSPDVVKTLDTSRYLDPAEMTRENQTLFAKLPIVVCHSSELAAGQLMTFDHLDKPLIITRDREGVAHAFVNACRHRGTRLVDETGVCKKTRIICPYHAWAYKLSGELSSVPLEQQAFPGMDKSEFGLLEVPTREVGGLIFVQLDPDSPFDPDKVLAPLAADFEVLEVGRHTVFAKQPTKVRTNWKLVADAFLESYHIQRLHAQTLAPFFMDGVTDSDDMGLHIRSAVARADLKSVSNAPSDPFELRSLVTYSYTLFPNATLIVSPDYMNLLAFYPISVNETLIVDTMLIEQPPQTPEEQDHWHRSFRLLDGGVFQSEDYEAARRSQAGLESGAIPHMTLGAFEDGLIKFHSRRDALVAGEVPAQLAVD